MCFAISPLSLCFDREEKERGEMMTMQQKVGGGGGGGENSKNWLVDGGGIFESGVGTKKVFLT